RFTFTGVNCSTLQDVSENSFCSANPGGEVSSIQAYAITQFGLAHGMSMPQIRSLGGGPSQYLVASGEPLTGVNQIDIAPFVQDDWRIRPNIVISTGMRYEAQTNIGNWNAFAPRIGLAWGIGPGQGRLRTPKTVIRAGFGLFYDRVNMALTLAALRQNGIVQQ